MFQTVTYHFHEVHERDENHLANLKEALRITYQVTHPGKNKQSVPLALAKFQDGTSAAIKSYFCNRLDAANANFLTVFYKVFVICNSKQRFNTSNQLGNAAIEGDQKPEFLLLVADWVEIWSEYPSFTFTKQTFHPLVTTLKCIANLSDDLLTSRFQGDPVERHYSKYRQMSGGRFLVSLREVNNSEKILSLNSIIKADLKFWEENIYAENTIDSVTLDRRTRFKEMTNEFSECQLNEKKTRKCLCQ